MRALLIIYGLLTVYYVVCQSFAQEQGRDGSSKGNMETGGTGNGGNDKQGLHDRQKVTVNPSDEPTQRAESSHHAPVQQQRLTEKPLRSGEPNDQDGVSQQDTTSSPPRTQGKPTGKLHQKTPEKQETIGKRVDGDLSPSSPAKTSGERVNEKSGNGPSSTTGDSLESQKESDNAQRIPDPPDFYTSTGLAIKDIANIQHLPEEIAVDSIKREYVVRFKADSHGQMKAERWVHSFDRTTRKWQTYKQAAQPRVEKISKTSSEDSILSSPDFTYTSKQHEESDQSQDSELSVEAMEANLMYEEGVKLMARGGHTSRKKAFQLFNSASLLNHTKSRELLAFSYMYGDYVVQNMTKSWEMFVELANEGNPRGQLGLGIMSASGIHVNSSQAKALIYVTFAALGGDELAQMVMGYRHLSGIGVPSSCETALIYYRRAAKRVAEKVTISGGPAIQRVRLADEAEAAGTSSSSILDDDIVQYYKFLADKGDTTAQVGLGQLFLQGTRGVEVNPDEAYHYFMLASQAGNAHADAYLGRMYAEGSGSLQQDYQAAFEYFSKSAEQGNPVGQSGLGLMYLKGHAVQRDVTKAFQYFKKSADQNWVDGQLQLGIMYYNGLGVRRDYKSALKYFNQASQNGNVLAFYNLAQMHATGTGVMRACHTAVELFKNVAERGPWAKLLMDAYYFYTRGYVDVALLKYLVAAELGYEVAQNNVAHILDSDESNSYKGNDKFRRALLQWSRAANQGSTLARLKLGDYHYYGLGTDIDYEQAIQHYRVAGEQQNNAQAMYNLGYMHEAGLGLKQDLHLAKRFYDMAMEANKDANVPVSLALTKLSLISNLAYLSNTSHIWEILSSLHPQAYLGPSWDMYFLTILGTVFGLLYILRTHVLRPI